MSNFSKAVLSVAIILTIHSCRTITSPSETANIVGRVMLLGPGYRQFTPPYNGVQIKMEGTSFSALSDSNGYYSFTGVPTGTYNVSFTKPGYGTVRWMSATVTGGGNAPIVWSGGPYSYAPGSVPYQTQYLFKIPNLVVTLGSIDFKDTAAAENSFGNALIARGTVTPDPLIDAKFDDAIVLFVSHRSNVTDVPGHYDITFWRWEGFICGTYPNYPVDTTTNRFTYAVPTSSLKYYGFKSGDSIYVAAYGTSSYYANAGGDYYDPILQQWVFTAINPTPSPVIGTVVP